ncbi:MAG: AAA family ATPase, partial [Fimbriimonadales bacterium]|nr:AAA family ATPase [Fimbriimonadales bacterium]
MQALTIAAELYELIEQALTLELEDAERVFLLRQAFDTIVRDLTLSEPYVFSDNAARWAYVQTKFQIPDDLVWQVDCFRRLTRPNAPAFGQDEINASAAAVAQLVEHLSAQPVPANLASLCAGARFPAPAAAALKPLDYLRACVLDPPEQKTDRNGRPYMYLRCRVEEPTGMGIVTVLLQDLWAETPIWQNAVFSATNLGILNSALVATRDSFVVVEPDLLLSVTDVSDCVMFQGHNPHIFLLRRFQRSDSSAEMLIGNLVNALYDALLQDPNADFDACFDAACQQNAVRLALLPSANSPRFLDDLRAVVRNPHYGTLQMLLTQLRATPVYIEPTILAPKYGVQGRLDTLLRLHPSAPTEYGLFELKSGSAPQNGATVWPNNAAQAQLYQLMLEAFSDGRMKATTGVLYSKAPPANALRSVPADAASHRRLVYLRNLLAAMEFMMAHSPETLLETLLRLTENDVPRYMQASLEALQSAWRNARDHERAYFAAFAGFVAREHLQARLGGVDPLGERNDGFADLWRKTIPEKARAYSLIADAQVIHYNAHDQLATLEFPPQYRVSNFREGDIVVLYRQDVHPLQPALRQPILKGTIKAMYRDACRVEVKLRTEYVHSLDGVWAVEPDLMDVNFLTLYRSLTDFLSASRTRRDLLLGQVSPQQPHALVTLPQDELFRRLTPLQHDMLRRALSAPDYFLLQGPPGTGKTNVMLRSMVHFLLNYTNENILLLAFTRRAVNEICAAIHDMDYLRLGSLDALDVSIDPEKSVDYIAQQYGVEEVRRRLQQARVIVSTVAGCLNTPELMERKRFDVAIIDEASQLLEPHLVGILSQVKRFILIGDQNQLPAVVVQSPEQTRVQDARLAQIGVSDLRVS